VLSAFTLLLHAPFLARPFHNDEPNYLDFAANVFDHPLTPLNFTYIFQGMRLDAAGHPHPPLVMYLLAALWSLRGWASPEFFHAVYLIFPLTIAWAAYFIAEHFLESGVTKRPGMSAPLWVALLVSAAPAVQVAANSVETDTPALAFLLAGAVFFLARRWLPAAILFTLAGFTALQTLPVVVILTAGYVLRRERPASKAILAIAAPFVALGLWQLSQLILIGRLPAAKLAGYILFPAFATLQAKLGSALVLLGHLGATVVVAPFRLSWRRYFYPWLLLVPWAWPSLYPYWERALLVLFLILGLETVLWIISQIREQPLLTVWCLLYFAFALVVFFAGAARYLMPLAVPLAILFVRQNTIGDKDRRWRLWATLVIGTVLGLNLAFADYELARVYSELPAPPNREANFAWIAPPGKDFLVDGEWGFRYAMTRRGGKPIETSSPARPGEWIIKSDLSGGDFRSPAEALAVSMESRDLRIRTPFRVIDRGRPEDGPGYAHSGFESSGFGLLPFSFSNRPIDHVTYSLVSPFLDSSGWIPTRIDDRLVFLAPPDQNVTVAADPRWQTCRVTLFARGRGGVSFIVPPFFAEQVTVESEFRHAERFRPLGGGQMTFRIEAAPGVQAGWEELVCY
jgi:hypothetical protein